MDVKSRSRRPARSDPFAPHRLHGLRVSASSTLDYNGPTRMSSKLDELKQKSHWLSEYAANVHSQCGEDGIAAKALRLIPSPTKWCVEFGAWDGRHLSNTLNLVANFAYRAVLIEADPKKFVELRYTYPHPDRAVFVNKIVGFDTDGLDSILSSHPVPRDFDLLSIDIDGNDYHVWDRVEAYRPRLVLIEYNPTISNSVHFVQKKQPGLCEGASAAALVNLGKRKGYELIAVTLLNLLFVVSEHFALFGIADNSLALMRDDAEVPHIFVGYNGHVRLAHGQTTGCIKLPWHGLSLKENDVQVLPPRLQKYPDLYTRFDRLLYQWHFGFQRPRQILRGILAWQRRGG